MKRIFPTSMVTVYVFGDDGEVCAGTLYSCFIHQTIHKPLSRQSRSTVPTSVFALLYQIPQSKKDEANMSEQRVAFGLFPTETVVKSTTMASTACLVPGRPDVGEMMQPVRPRLGNGGLATKNDKILEI